MFDVYYTRKMLTEIRKKLDEIKSVDLPTPDMIVENTNICEEKSAILESNNSQKEFVIQSNDIQFGNVRNSQADAIKKTVGDVSLKPDALKYYPEINDIVLNGEVSGLGVAFQYRYKDPSGDGCYIWCEGLQMSDSNIKTIEKIRDAFLNWKQSIVEDGDLLDKLEKEANKQK